MEIREAAIPGTRYWVIEDAVDVAILSRVSDEIAGWPKWVRYENDCERHKRACRDVDRIGAFTVSLFAFLQSAEWVRFLSTTTGIADLQTDPTLHGGGIHATDPGGYLQSHIDYALHPVLGLERRLNAVLFLNAWVSPRWGGDFVLYDDMGQEPLVRVPPQPGRMVLWEPTDTAFHGTDLVTSPAGIARLTAAVYYLAPARPGVNRKRALFVPRRAA